MIILWTLLGCSEQKELDTSTEETGFEDVETVYGTCSLEGASFMNNEHTAYSLDAASVVLYLSYNADELGVQEEEHPMAQLEADSSYDEWFLELNTVSNIEDVVLGESTLYRIGDRDKIFLALNEDGDICDCWDPDSMSKFIKDCSDFGAPE